MASSDTSSMGTRLSLEDESFFVKGSDVIDVFGLECDVCKDLYDRGAKLPKVLQCSHTICRACLDSMTAAALDENEHLSQDDGDSVNIKCPQCQKQFCSDTIENLPNDRRVLKGMEAVEKAKANLRNVCFKHDCQKLDRFCEKCEEPVCTDCISLYHTLESPGQDEEVTGLHGLSSFREADDHSIIDLTQALKNMEVEFNELERKCTTSLELKKVKREILRNIKCGLEKNQEDQLRKAEMQFDNYNKLLLERKGVVLNMIRETGRRNLSEVNLEVQRLEGSVNGLLKLFNSFITSRESEDFRQIFKHRKQLMSNDMLNVLDYEFLCKTLEFEVDDGRRVEEDLTTVGNIQTKIDPRLQCPQTGSEIGQKYQNVFQISAPLPHNESASVVTTTISGSSFNPTSVMTEASTSSGFNFAQSQVPGVGSAPNTSAGFTFGAPQPVTLGRRSQNLSSLSRR